MTPGIHERVPSATYHAWRAANVHTLLKLRQSPLHAKSAMETPHEPTQAMAFGTWFHDLIGMGDSFGDAYACGIVADGRTKEGKAARAAHEAAHAGKTIIQPDEWAQLHAMRDAARGHARAARLLRSVEGVEVSAVWTDPEFNVLCKSRSDLLVPKYRTIVDVKTTRNASPHSFEKDILDYGYHIQAAHYLNGWRVLGRDFAAFAFLAVEKEPPYGVCLYTLSPEAIEAGRTELRTLLAIWKRCMDTNEWPGYPTEVQEISLPEWYLRRMRNLGMEAA